mmetsp:Transcript_14567/g.31671  ORF Transcript_14567/g.31671 Transcript_14567/m.31671 type:complete len:277 (-) Transcript_14567:112-942(-)
MKSITTMRPLVTTLLIILAMLPSGRTDALNTSTTRVLADDCGGCNTGQCIEPAISNLSNNVDSSSSTLGSRSSCDCKGSGFIGEHCEVACSKECENGGKCLPAQESETGAESCSCSKAIVDGNPFAGLTCEYGATKSCMTLGSESKHSFCANGGNCQDIIGDNEQHKDCICKDGFEGSHCEYILGMTPMIVAGASAANDGSANHPQSNSETSDMIVFIMSVVIAALIGVLLLAFGVRARKRRSEAKRREREAREATEDLSMIPTHNERGNEENEII